MYFSVFKNNEYFLKWTAFMMNGYKAEELTDKQMVY